MGRGAERGGQGPRVAPPDLDKVITPAGYKSFGLHSGRGAGCDNRTRSKGRGPRDGIDSGLVGLELLDSPRIVSCNVRVGERCAQAGASER